MTFLKDSSALLACSALDLTSTLPAIMEEEEEGVLLACEKEPVSFLAF